MGWRTPSPSFMKGWQTQSDGVAHLPNPSQGAGLLSSKKAELKIGGAKAFVISAQRNALGKEVQSKPAG